MVLRAVAVTVLVASSLFSASCEGARARKLHAEATALVERGDFDGAVRVYEDLIERYPESPEAERAREEVQLYRGLSTAVDFYGARKVYDLMIGTARQVYRYENRRGRFPRSLDDLMPGYLERPAIDPWGRELRYASKTRRRGYVLACYGSDGERGGEGEARDWFIEDGRFVREPSVGLP